MPTHTSGKFGLGINELMGLNTKLSAATSKEIILDFTQSKLLTPFFLCGLATLVSLFSARGYDFKLNHTDNKFIRSYLATISFPECFSTHGDPNVLNYFFQKRYIPIIKFPARQGDKLEILRENILTLIDTVIMKQLGFSKTEQQPISYLLSELCQNINDHSKTEEGLIFLQTYPSKGYLDLGICDSGQGIYNSYEGNPRFSPKDEVEALDYAINGKSTKDRAEARGFGISTSRSMLVNGLGGKFFLWSGNTAFIQTTDRKSIVGIPYQAPFQGTFVALRVPTVIPKDFNFYTYVE